MAQDDEMSTSAIDRLVSSLRPDDLFVSQPVPAAASHWHEFVPLAHWLVSAARPRLLVQFGPHDGVSFGTFCSAMRRHEIDGKAFAVGTGVAEGLADAGTPGTVDPQFGGFVVGPEAAASLMSDKAIDLLHINADHFDGSTIGKWTDALSDRGLLLVQGISPAAGKVEIRDYWLAVRQSHPSFEFLHGDGLGIAAIGSAPPALIQALTALSEPDDIARIREWFSLAGRSHRALSEAYRLRADRSAPLQSGTEADGNDARLQTANAGDRVFYLERELSALMQKHASLTSSLSWRVTRPLRSIRAKLGLSAARINLLTRAFDSNDTDARRILIASLKRRVGILPDPVAPPAPATAGFELNAEDEAMIRALVARGAIPTMSALVAMGDADQSRLDIVIKALDEQVVPLRQIIIAMPKASPARDRLEDIARQRADVLAAWTDAPLSGALEPVDAILLLSGSATPKPEATAVFATEMQVLEARLVYSDEVFVGPDGRHGEPFYKPVFSPRLAAGSHYIGQCALIAVRPDAMSSDLSAMLAGIAQAGHVAPYLTQLATDLTRHSVRRAPFVLFEETALERETLPAPSGAVGRTHNASVAILIPTRDRLGLLKPCIESILATTDYPRAAYEIIVIDNGSSDRETLDYLAEGQRAGKFRALRDDGGFNYARLNNLAARATDAEILVFLNNDTLIGQPDWLARMVDVARQDEVGLVGAKLLYEDGTVQHGGVILGIQGMAAHADLHRAADSPGYHGLALHDREISAVTGACMATRRDHFWSVGGFDETLAVAFNDILLCTGMMNAGLTNIVLNSVRITHLESKSRGLDDTQDKRQTFLAESRYAREKAKAYFQNDPYYNPNLSLQDMYLPAPFSRRRKPWRSPAFKPLPRVLILSCTHQRGHGVPVVVERHVEHMVALGWDVHVGGPVTPTDHHYQGSTRIALDSATDALAYALAHDIDIVMPHTPPFFSVSRSAGPYPVVAAYDYGEPPPYLFPNAHDRWNLLQEKTISLSLAHRLYGISESVKDEAGLASMTVMPLGNSHMSRWSPDKMALRRSAREAFGWTDKVVVLNVCRFQKSERQYKGVDFFIEVSHEAKRRDPEQASSVVFVQCGKADEKDVLFVRSAGLTTFHNVTDEEMARLYCAADIYANFSQWEGWNLGIAQALAYGLPVVASDIAAHRKNFDVVTVSTPAAAWTAIDKMADAVRAANFEPRREALIDEWEPRLKPFTDDLLEIWRKS